MSLEEQYRLVKQVADSIIESVKACGKDGAPGGILYSALMTQGCTIHQFNSLMGGLCAAGKLRKSGDLYFAN